MLASPEGEANLTEGGIVSDGRASTFALCATVDKP